MTIRGFLNIDKPAGITSHDVVARIRHVVGRKVKVGHAGTLDPAATGVLPIALGHATRLISYLADTNKGYRGVVQLGQTTTTDDSEGDILAQRPIPPLTPTAIERVLAMFRGTIMQVPPMYSALHHQGQKLYKLAREGQVVERLPRPVIIYDLQGSWQADAADKLILDVVCGKGTYIRALARDIGEQLGCGGYLAALERTFVGTLTQQMATPLSTLLDNPAILPHILLPLEFAVADWQMVVLNEDQCQQIHYGRAVSLPGVADATEQLRGHTPSGELLVLLCRRGDVWHPDKVFL
jgi:tRNA pseudouridine55 synthase